MRLRGWHVEGFGLLHDFQVEGLSDGVTVVLGPNEAGKTSLLAFIRGALFGYPDRRRRDRQYPPLRGGRHGGRLFVESDQSMFVVERFASPSSFSLTQPDGAVGTEADLHQLLGGVDAELHRNVFAFSLTELQEFASLQVEGVRDRIFAAGVVGAGRSARVAIGRLVSQREEIGRRRGDCRITTLRNRLRELEELLRDAKARATRHPELRRATDELDEEQRRIGRDLADARRDMAHLDALLTAWPDWDEREQAEKEFELLADVPDLPNDLGTRLESALADVRTQGDRHKAREESVFNLERRLSDLRTDEQVAAVAQDVKRLASQIGNIRTWRARVGTLNTQYDVLQKRLADEAPRLGPGWTLNSVRVFDASIPAAQVIADWGERLDESNQAVRELEDEARRSDSNTKELADEWSRRLEALKRASPLDDLQTLSERDAAVRRLRPRLALLVQVRAELQAATQRVSDASRRADAAKADAERIDAEMEQRSSAIRNSPELPTPDQIAIWERGVRDLRTALAELAAGHADLRAANQRALDVEERATEAEQSAASAAAEIDRRDKILAEANSVPEAEVISSGERTARELRRRLADLDVLSRDLRVAQDRRADRQRDDQLRAPALVMPGLKRKIAVAVGVLVVLAVVLLILSQVAAAVVAIVVAIAGMVIAFALSGVTTPAADGSAGTAEADRNIQELSDRISLLNESAKSLAAKLGFSELPDRAELEDTVDMLGVQYRARQERDREASAIEQLRVAVEQTRARAAQITKLARDAQGDNAVSQRVCELEAVILTNAKVLAFAELPTVAALEEKAAEVREFADKIREREMEMSAVRALEHESTRARNLSVRLEKEFMDLTSDITSNHKVRVSECEEATIAIARTLGLLEIPEPAELEEAAKQIDDQLRVRRDRDREVELVEALRRSADAGRTVVEETLATLATRREEHELLRANWSTWKASNGCPEALRPETALQFFASVERLRESVGQLDSMAAERTKIQTELSDYSENVFTVAERVGLPRTSELALAEDVVEGLRERVEADAGLRVERTRIGSELERARHALANTERDCVTAANTFDSVLFEAGAVDERDCRARIDKSRLKVDLAKRVQESEYRLRSRLGIGPQADVVRTELRSGERQEWDARKSDCKGMLARSQPLHEDALRRHQTAIESLSALERECDVVTIATEREAVVAEMRDAMSEWRLLAIAQSLVQSTLRRYEVERQPAVLTRTASSFSRITEGRYHSLVTREDGIDVIAADGSRLDAAALSRGTAEQLYLCLRLALAAEFGRLSVPLPFVMDDVLVNFDPERAKRAAEILLAAAPDHQILLFTCHPETVDLFVSLDSSTRVIEIQRQLRKVIPNPPDTAVQRS